jgi:hypothetical protein
MRQKYAHDLGTDCENGSRDAATTFPEDEPQELAAAIRSLAGG